MSALFPSPIQFLHLRRFSLAQYSMDYHIEPIGGMSIAYQLHNFLEHKFVAVVISIARCRDDELFNKKIGREVALARLKSFPLEKFDPTKPVAWLKQPTFLVKFTHEWIYNRVQIMSGMNLPLTTDSEVATALLERNSRVSQEISDIVEHRLGRSNVELETVANLRRGIL